MNQKTIIALKNAEKNYVNLKNLEEKNLNIAEHILALNALFESFIYYGFAASQVADAIKELDEQTYLFEVLIEPHLRVVDDIEMISRQYTPMFIKYIAHIAVGIDSQKAVEKLFA